MRKYLTALLIAVLLAACSTAHSPGLETQPQPGSVSVDAQLDKLSREIARGLSQPVNLRIAVLEFNDLNGNVSDLSKFLAEELTTRLFTSGKFQVIERRLIEKILMEQKLSMTGVIDAKTAMKVGAILGADFIAAGTTADLGTSIKINARIISVEKGSLVSAASTVISKSDQVQALMGKGVARDTAPIIGSLEHDISGTWKFVCCSGKYWGEIDLAMDENNKIKGQYYDMANKSGGTIDGTIKGNSLLFTRNKGEQDYKLTLSDDGKTMSGFFVGSHDGSVGTEVTFTRGNQLLTSSGLVVQEGVFTSWREGGEFGKEMDKYWKDGYYPATVEGRNYAGQSQFRALLQAFPKRVWWFYWWYGQARSSYEEHKKRMTAEGFKEINLQVFTDSDGSQKYQTCWIKYGS